MKKSTYVFIVIGFNNLRLTEQLIINFQSNARNIELWIYDNASKESLEKLAKKYKLPYFRSERNLGYAGGCNSAINWALDTGRYEVICLLNNDVFINGEFSRNLNTALNSFVENKKIAAMTPLLYLDENLTQPENFGIWYYESGLAFQNRYQTGDPTALLNGAFFFIKSKVCKRLMNNCGFVFLPWLFFNAEDLELSLRLLSMGYQIRIEQSLKAQHLSNQSLGEVSKFGLFYSWRNLIAVLFITRSVSMIIINLPYIVVGQLILIVTALRHGYWFLVFEVYKDILARFKDIKKSRKAFLKNKKVSLKGHIRDGIFPLSYINKL